MGDDRAAVYEEDGKVYYRASSLGGCLTMLAAARQQLEAQPPSGKQLEIYEAGNDAEDWVLGNHLMIGNLQEEVVLSVTKRISVVGHIDGEYVDGDYPAKLPIVEIKSQSPDLFDVWTPDYWTEDELWKKYAWQVSAYMLAKGKQLEMIRVRREEPLIFQSVQTIEKPFHTLDEIRNRILTVEALAADSITPCTTPNFFCPYPYLHPQPEPIEDTEMEGLVVEYLAAKSRVDTESSRVKAIKADIEKRLDGREKVLLLSGATISRSEFEVKEHTVKASRQVRVTVKGGALVQEGDHAE